MKYTASVDDKTYEYDLHGPEEAIELTGGGLSGIATLGTSGEDRYILRIGERTIEGWVTPNDEGYLVLLEGRTYQIAVADDRARALAEVAGAKPKVAGGTIKAPMPGLVKSVNVAVGDEVHRGTSLIILEAMKMENDLTAPGNGTIKEVRVKAGDKVDQGQVLVVIEG